MKYKSQYINSLNEHILTFSDGAKAYTKYYHIGEDQKAFGKHIMLRCRDLDSELTEEQDEAVDRFVEVNKWRAD